MRYSRQIYYKNISDKYKNHNVKDINNVLQLIKNENLKEKIIILKSIKYYLLNSEYYIIKYDKMIKQLEKERLDCLKKDSWKSITGRYTYYMKYYKNHKSYHRNLAIISLVIELINEIQITDILELKLSYVTTELTDSSKYYHIETKSKSKIKLLDRTINLSDKMHKILFNYIEHDNIKENENLFNINISRVSVIISTFIKININKIKEISKKLNSKYDDILYVDEICLHFY